MTYHVELSEDSVYFRASVERRNVLVICGDVPDDDEIAIDYPESVENSHRFTGTCTVGEFRAWLQSKPRKEA